MRIVFMIVFSFVFLNAQMSLINDYRQNPNWQEKMDQFLYSDEYINFLLKNKDVKFGYYDNPTNIIVCYKAKKILDVYDYDNSLKLEGRFDDILTGKNKGDKWVEGDDKTPIGVYTLEYKLTDNELSDFYGPLAYPTDYPNLYDKYLGKTGHGIWIHGFPKNDPHRDFDTKGCIALPNNKLIDLSKMINYKNSVLIIDTDNLPTTTAKKISIILKNIFKWRYDWKYNKLKNYLSFYDKDVFKKENKYNFKQFAAMKKEVFSHQKNKIIKFKNIKIIPYPSKYKNIYRVSFDEYFKSNDSKYQGKKIIYLRLIDNNISIFLEN